MMSRHDRFELRILFRTRPLGTLETARALLEALQRELGELAPTAFHDRHDRSEPLSPAVVARAFARGASPDALYFSNDAKDVGLELIDFGGDEEPGGELGLKVPFASVAGQMGRILDVVRAVATLVEPLYGWAHSAEDKSKKRDPNVVDAWAPKQVYQAYWLTILGAPIVQTVGEARIATTPAERVEFLSSGAALIVTSPDPGDVVSPAARAAQARALVHLRPELDEAAILREMNERTARVHASMAVPEVGSGGATSVAPSVDEWRPREAAWASDVEDVAATVRTYADEAERYIVGFHASIAELLDAEPVSLAAIDRFFDDRGYWQRVAHGELERLLVPALGSYLGRMLVRELDGQWMPRRALLESQVLVGDRAWLPFLRVQRFLQSYEAARAHSLAAFFAAARDSVAPR